MKEPKKIDFSISGITSSNEVETINPSRIKSFFEGIFYWIYNLYWKCIGWKIKKIYRSVYNIIRWIPVLWKDCDWDHTFIMDILKFKLKNTADYLEKREFYTKVKEDVKNIKLCIRLIDKINNGYYEVEYLDGVDCKFVFEDVPGKEECYRIKKDPEEKKAKNDKIYKEYININRLTAKKAKLYLKKNKKNYTCSINDPQLIALTISHFKHEKAKKILFNILKNHMECWWD